MHKIGFVPAGVRVAAGALIIASVAFASGEPLLAPDTALARSMLMQSAAAVSPALPNSPRLRSNPQQFSFADLVERVSPAVVSVQVDVERAMQSQTMPEI